MIDGNASQARQSIYEFRRRHDARIDPVDVRKIPAADMMVNVDQETLFEALEKRAPHAVAFEQDDSVVRRYGIRPNGAIGKRQVLVNTRNAVVHDDFCILAHGAQNLTAGKG